MARKGIQVAQAKRLAQLAEQFDFTNPVAIEKLSRIALLLENQTKLNVRRQRLVDTGNLLNSIRAEWRARSSTEATIEWGSYGVRYAAVHEYGFQGNVIIPEHVRRSAKGNAHVVKQHSRFVRFQPRPYIRPSLVQHRQKILKLLLEMED